ncbi:MAG: hypothetical protein ACO3SO_09885, partial [Luteolibacter sp.]
IEGDGFEAGGVELSVKACDARFVFSGLGKILPSDGERLIVAGGALLVLDGLTAFDWLTGNGRCPLPNVVVVLGF